MWVLGTVVSSPQGQCALPTGPALQPPDQFSTLLLMKLRLIPGWASLNSQHHHFVHTPNGACVFLNSSAILPGEAEFQ